MGGERERKERRRGAAFDGEQMAFMLILMTFVFLLNC